MRYLDARGVLLWSAGRPMTCLLDELAKGGVDVTLIGLDTIARTHDQSLSETAERFPSRARA
jgi:hypothetical protein